MRGNYGNLEVDVLNKETFEFLSNGSLMDRIRAFEKLQKDSNSDKEIIKKLHSKIKKEYSSKIMNGMATQQMFDKEN